jgi:hypothetical protein
MCYHPKTHTLLLLTHIPLLVLCFSHPSQQTSNPARYRAWLAASDGDITTLDAALMEELREPLFPDPIPEEIKAAEGLDAAEEAGEGVEMVWIPGTPEQPQAVAVHWECVAAEVTEVSGV